MRWPLGDTRKYDYVVPLRAVETIDFMTAPWARLPDDFLNLRIGAATSRTTKALLVAPSARAPDV